MQEQNDAGDARMIFFFLYMDGHSNHLLWLNNVCKVKCLQRCSTTDGDALKTLKDTLGKSHAIPRNVSAFCVFVFIDHQTHEPVLCF